MKRMLTPLMSALCLAAASCCFAAMPKVIAHRGHWIAPGSAQNSVRSLVKADSINCYGSEFDVWITADGIPVVNHDRNIDSLIIERSPAAEVTACRLANGEHVATLDAMLDSAASLSVKLILELKEHSDTEAESRAVDLILDAVARRGLQPRMEYITFSRHALHEFIRKAPEGTPVYYLMGDMTPDELKAAGAAGLDYSRRTMEKHPEWIDRAHSLGLKVNVWTIDDDEHMQWCIDRGVDFITTNRPERLFRLMW